ncbi:DUF3016 domain-containing protein [Beijerinckia mobilis]|uniref:DUF3016 domain-containing protein n=1 Tax=Beijerinckia mobilis TaxID=231434 RepID=UPI0006905144|nr:DUF3016 domain-containing protein [Beijerinckia mobilis]
MYPVKFAFHAPFQGVLPKGSSRLCLLTFALALCGLVAGFSGANATTRVIFYHPDRYSDSAFHNPGQGSTPSLVMSELNQYIQSLGNLYLPADQDLTVEILNIQLARFQESWAFTGNRARTPSLLAPPPRITLRYTLTVHGQPFIDAQETLFSMNNLLDQTGQFLAGPFQYEKAILNDWFQRRIVQHDPVF